MLFFPQLSTGTAAQYPLRKIRAERIVTNRSLDRRDVKYRDATAAELTWSLTYRGLSDSELSKLEELFRECQGQLKTFVFLDPAANLLRWSEEFDRSVWAKQGGLTLAGSQPDPWESSRATQIINGSPVPQALEQSIVADASFQFTFSCWVKGVAGQSLQLAIASNRQSFLLDGTWQRLSFSAKGNASGDQVVFGLTFPPSSTTHLVAAQAEAQPAPGPYLITTSVSGVYDQARFAQDAFQRTTYGTNDHATMLRVRTNA